MKRRGILLVEDNPDHEELAMRALRKSGLADEIAVARDGAEALRWLFEAIPSDTAENRPLPGLVLLDLKLPKVDGLEVLRQVRAHDRTRLLPVVVLSSSDEERDLVAAYSLGANSYVTKPVDFNEFTEAIRQLGVYWLGMNQGVPRR